MKILQSNMSPLRRSSAPEAWRHCTLSGRSAPQSRRARHSVLAAAGHRVRHVARRQLGQELPLRVGQRRPPALELEPAVDAVRPDEQEIRRAGQDAHARQ